MTTISDATDGREGKPLGVSAAVLEAARQALDAWRAKDALKGEPRWRRIERRLSGLGRSLPWSWDDVFTSVSMGSGRSLSIVEKRDSQTEWFCVCGYLDDNGFDDLDQENVFADDDLEAAVLRMIHRLMVARPTLAPEPAVPVADLPAYPCDAGDGLTLRDQFAAVALPAIYAEPGTDRDYGTVAALAYAMADHMIAARSQPSDPDVVRAAEMVRSVA